MIFAVLFVLFVLYWIRNMTKLYVHATSRTRQFEDSIQAASSFARRNNLPVRLENQLLDHLSFKYRTDSEGLHEQETIESLPKGIRSSISNYLFYPLVDQVYVFRGVSNDVLFQLVSEMKPEYFPPGEDVILQDEAPTNMYILVTGAVELILQRSGIEKVVGGKKTGDVVGEVGLLCYKSQVFTVRTKRLSQLLRLNRTSFLNIVQANVEAWTIIMNNLLQHLKEIRDPAMEGILAETDHILTQGRMNLPLTLCFAVLKGNDLLLKNLLERGSDPDESDNNKRTALHIAASNGNINCVNVLLKHGADPNSRDIEGTTALHSAISKGNIEIIKFLLDQGADIDVADIHGKTPRALAEHQGNEEIQTLFQTRQPV